VTRKVIAHLPWFWGTVGVVGLVAVWQLVCTLFAVPVYLLPSPWATLTALWADAAILGPHLATTAIEAFSGLALAVAFGVAVAVAMSASRPSRDLLYPPLVLSQAVPLIAVAPLVLIWFGLGPSAKVLIVAFVCFFPITVNAYEGFRTVDPLYLELLRTLGARRRDVYRHLYLPATLPGILAGLRVGATYSVLGAVVGEWLGGSRGLGVYMIRALQSFRTDRLFAAIWIVMLMSLAMFKLVDGVSGRLTPWLRRRQRA
jgi:ABC-type nitrate/sulfonate/bicarbonate transport system permease component